MSIASSIPESDLEWSFADRLRKARRVAKLSQRAMADALGVPEKRYANWEAGHLPRGLVDIARRASSTTGAPVEWLLGLSKTCFTVDAERGEPALQLVGAAAEIS